MKSTDPQFDAHLCEAFTRANSHIRDDPEFTRKVVARLQSRARLRNWVLGGAASSGSALAGRQLANLVGQAHFHNPLLARGFELFGPDALMTMGFTLLAGLVVLLLPKRGW